MTYSITALAYLSLLVSISYFSFRLFSYWQKEKNIVSKLWFIFTFIFCFFPLVKLIGVLFFAQSPVALERTIDIGGFIQALALAVAAYLVVFVRFPNISPWYGFSSVFLLGIISAVFTVLVKFQPFIEPSGAINWGYSNDFYMMAVSVSRTVMYLITFLPLIIISLQQFRKAQDFYAKRKALGIALTLCFLVFVAFVDFFVGRIFAKEGPFLRDLGYIIASAVLIITLAINQSMGKKDSLNGNNFYDKINQ
jgi:hypothetical protein